MCGYPKFSDEENKIENIYYNFLSERKDIDVYSYNCEVYFSTNSNNYVAYSNIIMNAEKNFTIDIYDIKQL